MSTDDFEDLREHAPHQSLDDQEAEAFAADVVGTWSRARRTRRTRRRAAWAAVAVAATLLAVLGLSRALAPGPTHTPEPRLAEAPSTPSDDRILASDGADYVVQGTHGDRTVALSEGRIRCEVEHRAAGERFRVVVGDAVVSVTGTAFTVVAAEGALTEVEVDEGSVELRIGDGPPITLEAGDHWMPRRDTADPGPEPTPTAEPAPAPIPPRATPIRNDPDEAVPSPARSPSRPVGAALQRGLDLLDGGRPEAAAEAFAREEAQGALREDALFWRSIALLRAGRRDAAIDTMRIFLADFPSAIRADELHCVLGRSLRDAGRTDEARAHFQLAARSSEPRTAACGREGRDALTP